MDQKCYGNMFPRLDDVRLNEPIKGAVFGTELSSLGIGYTGKKTFYDREKWKKCLKCEDYRSCYDLSVAMLAFDKVIRDF